MRAGMKPSLSESFALVVLNQFLHFALIATVVLLVFGRTLGSYFLADDFGEVSYVSQIFAGDWHRLWSNFTGNYMQIPNMAVYRPWLLMTLLGDFCLWRANAAGYYATNLLHFLACSILLYLLVRCLTRSWPVWRSAVAALFSAVIFAAHPLHCESVSWVVGRVDIVCLMYYLLGLFSIARFTQSGNRGWFVLALSSYVIAILTKEMAIGLPVVATALTFLWSNDAAEHGRRVAGVPGSGDGVPRTRPDGGG
ncbi:MAG: glycosyltransferase family 39 protein, partial [Cyanobacteria bacterium]|nr:glycosyltransferase family 39 protein [Cyanobacteriota bacterium]